MRLSLQAAAEKECYHKVQQLHQYKMRQPLLQVVGGLILSTSIITKYSGSRSWYKNGMTIVILSILQYQTLETETTGRCVRVPST